MGMGPLLTHVVGMGLEMQVTIADPSILINSHGNGTVVMGMGEME